MKRPPNLNEYKQKRTELEYKNNSQIIKNGKSIGPVKNLEEHVRPDWWRYLFNAHYLRTDGDVIDDINITRNEVDQFIKILNLSPDKTILDLCCGQGRHVLELARRGFSKIYGLDLSHYLIQRAKRQAKKENLPVQFKEGDARKLPYSQDTFDAVMILGNSFGYFETLAEDLRVLKDVLKILKPRGEILIDVSDGDYLKENFKPHSWEWVDNDYLVCRERSISLDDQRLISREVIIKVDEGINVDQFYAERLYNKDSIKKLLEGAGFCNVRFHGELIPNSERKQDLGMMEKRIIVSAEVKKEWGIKKIKPYEKLKNVAVIMGDPSKPDKLKPLAVFDEDDLYTIDQLKNALREIKDYNFFYITNHDTIIEDLKQLVGKADIVLNLCDEGFVNDPRKELHIPAYLEMLRLPYTGSGPQCIAFCYDKSLVRGVAKEMDIPVAKAFFIKPEDTAFSFPPNIFFPVIVKPNFGDSSFGITQKSVVSNITELTNAILEIRENFSYEKPIIVEEFLTGEDISVGIIGNPPENYTVLPITKEDYSEIPPELPKICGYEAKWLPNSPYWNIKSIKANLPEETEKFVIECCLKLFKRLECRDYARFDWRLDSEGNPKLLEVNPNPGWCWDGHLAKMIKMNNMTYSDMLKEVIHSAEQRLAINN